MKPLKTNTPNKSDEKIQLIDGIINEIKCWLKEPKAIYPFNDLRLMSDTIAYGNLDPLPTTESLSRIDRLVEILANEDNHGSARRIEQSVDFIKKDIAKVDRLANLGSYRREQCSSPLKQSARKFIVTLGQVKKQQQTPNVAEKCEPLSKNAQIVYDILIELPPHKALTVPEILDIVGNKHKKYWDEKELYERIFPRLKPYGLKNKPRIGYWIPK